MNSIPATTFVFVQQHVFPAIYSHRRSILYCAVFVFQAIGKVYQSKDLSLHSFSVVIAHLRDFIYWSSFSAMANVAAALGYATFSDLAGFLSWIMIVKIVAKNFTYQSPPLIRSGIRAINPFLGMTPRTTVPRLPQSGNWETLPTPLAHSIMFYADLPSIINMQQTSKRMNELFQFQQFIKSALFKGSRLESQIDVVKIGDQFAAFKNNGGQTTESIIRLGFKAAGISAQDNLSDEKLMLGLKQMTSIVNQLFDQRLQRLRKWEAEREGSRHLSAARQVARYHVDLMLWIQIVSLCKNHYNIIFSGPSKKEARSSFTSFNASLNELLKKMLQFETTNRIHRAMLRIIVGALPPARRESWAARNENFRLGFSDRKITKKNINSAWIKKLRAYLASHHIEQFHEQEHFSSSFTFKPKSLLVMYGLAAGQLLRHIELIKSEGYWKMIDDYEQILSEGNEDWLPLCKQMQESAKATLDEIEDIKDYGFSLHPRLLLRLLTRGNPISVNI